MPTAQQLKKFKKALEAATEIFDDIDINDIALPIESHNDKIREAASVIAYFDMREKFREEICRGCNRKFAYAYYTSSVKHCSVFCLKKMLENIGLPWDPSKPYEERWGSRYVPAIVPAAAYEIIQEQILVTAEEPESAPAPISEEAQNLIKMLDSL